MIRSPRTRLRPLAADERGFTMVSVMLTMMVLGMFTAAAWAASNGDLPLSRGDQDRKAAYEAAEAGIQWYTHKLEQDTNVWATCSPTVQGVNISGTRSSWRTVPNPADPGSTESFAVEVMTAPGRTCDPARLDTTILNNGALRIRSTGTYRGERRQIVASFRRDGFLDFVWYTKRETSPPAAYTGTGTLPSWVRTNCDDVRAVRPNGNGTNQCLIIDFVTGDNIQGPMHTEDDSFSYAGSPIFGRTGAGDKIEVSGPGTSLATAFHNSGSGGGVQNRGNLVAPGRTISPPQDNSALRNFADVTLTGNSCLIFNGTTVTAYDRQTGWGANPARPIDCSNPSPNNGRVISLSTDTVIWVDNDTGGCPGGYVFAQKYTYDTCGNVAVSGSYNANVTIGAQNDIIANGNITRAAGSDGLMGLVANNFVRMYHPVNFGGSANCSTGSANLLATPVSHIDAAILATTGSFLNDNWRCGAPLGNLTIKGTIAQYWRGAVGTNGGGSGTGYKKDYQYDDRLKYRQPPQFLDPGTSQWHILRQTEQIPVQ